MTPPPGAVLPTLHQGYSVSLRGSDSMYEKDWLPAVLVSHLLVSLSCGFVALGKAMS